MTPSERIEQRIGELTDWRGPMLARVRRIVVGADAEIIEEWKWMGSPTWSRSGLIAVGNAHKNKVKLTFAYGAHLPDPAGLFNGNDTGRTRRSIDLFEGDEVDESALTELVRAAIAYNLENLKKNTKAGSASTSARP